ncbi:TPA: hypothetical protein ACKP22_000627 [Pseudomonas putida]
MRVGKKWQAGLSGLLALGILQGCASIVSDSKYPVEVSSTPPGTSFEVVNRSGKLVHQGVTPSVVTLPSGQGYFKGETYTLRFKREGFADNEVVLDSKVDGWYWSNLFLLAGGAIGMLIVDPLTGAMYKLPNQVSASLSPRAAGHSTQQGDSGLRVASINELTAEQRGQLIPLQ